MKENSPLTAVPEPPALRSSDVRRMTQDSSRCVWPDEKCDSSPHSRRLCVKHYYQASKLKRFDEFPRKPKPSGPVHSADRWLNNHGYVMTRTGAGAIVPEHRFVMEQAIGRKLVRGETVHHINGFRHDNRLENLELWFSPQPYGQRVKDLIAYVVKHHADELRSALSGPQDGPDPADG